MSPRIERDGCVARLRRGVAPGLGVESQAHGPRGILLIILGPFGFPGVSAGGDALRALRAAGWVAAAAGPVRRRRAGAGPAGGAAAGNSGSCSGANFAGRGGAASGPDKTDASVLGSDELLAFRRGSGRALPRFCFDAQCPATRAQRRAIEQSDCGQSCRVCGHRICGRSDFGGRVVFISPGGASPAGALDFHHSHRSDGVRRGAEFRAEDAASAADLRREERSREVEKEGTNPRSERHGPWLPPDVPAGDLQLRIQAVGIY